MSSADVGLPEALERAASALPRDADAIRPANGDPVQLAQALDANGASRVLGWLLAHEPVAGEELASAWAEDLEGAGQAVLSLDPGALPKAARKSLRRVLHRLRSQGRAVPEAERQRVVASLPPLDDTLHEARVSPIDPRGARVVYLALDHPSGGVRLFETVLDPTQGILEFEVYSAGRRRVRRFLRDFERAGTLRATAAPPDSVRALIARAVAAQPESRPLPRGFAEWRNRLTEVGQDVQTPGEIAREALGSDTPDEAEALFQVEEWVRGGSLGPWPPPVERARAVAEQIAESGKGVLVVSGGARREQVDGALDRALEEVYDAAMAEHTAERLEECAYLMWRGAREDDARAALAAAGRFRAGTPVDNPVARAMLEVWLAPVLKQARGDGEEPQEPEQDEASSLLVTS
jgi:hypothetical protein